MFFWVHLHTFILWRIAKNIVWALDLGRFQSTRVRIRTYVHVLSTFWLIRNSENSEVGQH
eukprot:COSAG02_NODE_203_length_29261_cov_20.960395_9_plen_60_part_00